MIDNTWALEVPEKILTIVQTRGQAILDEKFPNAFWTTDDMNNSNPTFPTIMFTFDCSETGGDLMGTDINAVLCMAQIDVTVTKEQGINNARYVAGVVLSEMKRLMFSANEMPQFNDNTNDLIRLTFRCIRIIGQADTL